MIDSADVSDGGATSAGGGLGGLGAAGGIGIFSLLAALFSRGNTSETLMLLVYGVMIETGRRLFNWLSKRVIIRVFDFLSLSVID
jgi:hypothetical protein